MSLSRIRACLLLSLPLALSACGRTRTDLAPLRERAAELRVELAAQQQRISEMRRSIHQRDDLAAALVTAVTQQKEELQGVLAEVQSLQERFHHYQQDYKRVARAAAPGMLLGNVVIHGQLYRELVVKTLDDHEIVFRHADGAGRAEVAALPMALKERFVLGAAPSLPPRTVPVAQPPVAIAATPVPATRPAPRAATITDFIGTLPGAVDAPVSVLEQLYRSRNAVSPQIYRRQRGMVMTDFMGRCAN
jgi:hypothetical protein